MHREGLTTQKGNRRRTHTRLTYIAGRQIKQQQKSKTKQKCTRCCCLSHINWSPTNLAVVKPKQTRNGNGWRKDLKNKSKKQSTATYITRRARKTTSSAGYTKRQSYEQRTTPQTAIRGQERRMRHTAKEKTKERVRGTLIKSNKRMRYIDTGKSIARS